MQDPAETEMPSDYLEKVSAQVCLPEPDSKSRVEEHEEPQHRMKERAWTHPQHKLNFLCDDDDQSQISDSESSIQPHAAEHAQHQTQSHVQAEKRSAGVGLIGKVTGKVTSYLTGSSSSKENCKPKAYRTENVVGTPLSEATHALSTVTEENRQLKAKMSKMSNEFKELLNARELSLKDKLRALKNDNDYLMYDLGQKEDVLEKQQQAIQRYRSRIQVSEAEKNRIQDEHDTFICEQQKASFNRMESARWLPKQESEVMADLQRMKTTMRTWAKGVSIKDTSILQSLDVQDFGLLLQDLGQVVQLEDGQFPQVLYSATRAPVLLLNALLAHDVYTKFFLDPFFCIDILFTKIYKEAKEGEFDTSF